VAAVTLLTACGGSVDYTPLPGFAPASTGKGGSIGPLSASPASLSFSGAGTQAIAVSDPGFSGAYTVSGCSGMLSYGTVANGSLSVTSAGTGTCTLTISDTFSHSTIVSVAVGAQTSPII
jgi:hypothetical protein